MGPGSSEGHDEMAARRERDVSALLTQITYLEEEIGLLRRKVADSPRQVRALEERIAEAEGRAAFLSERNDKLAATLRDAREQLVTLKEEVNRLGHPPSGYGLLLTRHKDGTDDADDQHTCDEPDADKYRRLHVIIADAAVLDGNTKRMTLTGYIPNPMIAVTDPRDQQGRKLVTKDSLFPKRHPSARPAALTVF